MPNPKIASVRLKKIENGFIVEHYELKTPKGKEDEVMPRGRTRQEFFASESEARDKVSELSKDLQIDGENF